MTNPTIWGEWLFRSLGLWVPIWAVFQPTGQELLLLLGMDVATRFLFWKFEPEVMSILEKVLGKVSLRKLALAWIRLLPLGATLLLACELAGAPWVHVLSFALLQLILAGSEGVEDLPIPTESAYWWIATPAVFILLATLSQSWIASTHPGSIAARILALGASFIFLAIRVDRTYRERVERSQESLLRAIEATASGNSFSMVGLEDVDSGTRKLAETFSRWSNRMENNERLVVGSCLGGRGSRTLKSAPLSEIHSELLRIMRPQFSGTRFNEIRFEIDPGLSHIVLQHQPEVSQILGTLYRSSVLDLLADPVAHPAVLVRLVSEGPDDVTISISDNGSGASGRDFDALAGFGDLASASPEGVALRLTRRLAEHLGGSIQASSQNPEQRNGNTFVLRLKKGRREPAAGMATSIQPSQENAPRDQATLGLSS